MNERPEDAILALYDRALAEYGDTPKGALWPNARDRVLRFDVMLDVITDRPDQPVVLCDLGCGTGELLARIRDRGLRNVTYIGVDRSRRALELARQKFPGGQFLELDVTAPGADLSALACDYLVANGLFTLRHSASPEQMRGFLQAVVAGVWPQVRKGLAFNVMSKVVDRERDDLFHVSMDDMATLLHGLAGRRVRMRADYGLFEFTCYAWRTDLAPVGAAPAEPVDDGGAAIRVMRPQLPRTPQLLPYLERIDASRIYSNFGPLVLELEQRLARRFGLATGGVVSAGTGTAGLVGAILGHAGRAGRDRPLALMPAFTFVATAVAAELCGYTPYLVDVDPESWMAEASVLAGHPELGRVGLVIAVGAFGRLVPQVPWLRFSETTGIPVVIDAAASFESLAAAPDRGLGPIPVVLSLHATKSMASGEGGCVATTDLGLAAQVGEALNFGFHYSRLSKGPSSNGKMSEYHAAVGLAELDGWEDKQRAFAVVAASYQRGASEIGLGGRVHTAPDICSSYALFRCADRAESARVQESLRAQGIEFRLWYGDGLDGQPHFAACPADPLPVTKALAPSLLGLPMATDLSEATVARVLAAVRDGLSLRPAAG